MVLLRQLPPVTCRLPAAGLGSSGLRTLDVRLHGVASSPARNHREERPYRARERGACEKKHPQELRRCHERNQKEIPRYLHYAPVFLGTIYVESQGCLVSRFIHSSVSIPPSAALLLVSLYVVPDVPWEWGTDRPSTGHTCTAVLCSHGQSLVSDPARLGPPRPVRPSPVCAVCGALIADPCL